MKLRNAIVFTVTNNYVLGLKVFLKSYLACNNTMFDAVVYEEEPIAIENKESLLKIYPKIKFLTYKNNISGKINGIRKWAINPFNRFEIFNLDYDKIVFFDTDMIVLSKIDELMNFNIGFGAVYHSYPDGVESAVLTKDFTYNNKKFNHRKSFNAGLMVISRKYLASNIYDELINVANTYEWLGNQGPLNVVFNDKVELLDNSYFVTTPEITSKLYLSAKILHFAGEKKPWTNSSYDLEENFNHHVFETVNDRTVLLKSLLRYKKILKEVQ